jgi:hypothetical protein
MKPGGPARMDSRQTLSRLNTFEPFRSRKSSLQGTLSTLDLLKAPASKILENGLSGVISPYAKTIKNILSRRGSKTRHPDHWTSPGFVEQLHSSRA